MKKNLAVILVCLLSLFVACPAFSFTDKGIIKIAHSQKENDLFEDHYKAMTSVFRQIVERDTQGRFKVQVFPNGQLGDLRSTLEQCQKGIVQITTGQSIGNLAAYQPDLNLFETPFLFRDQVAVVETFKSPLGQSIVESLAKGKGLRILGIMPAGMRCFSNNVRPIKKPEDMKGLKMRTMEIPVYIKMMEALGANATPVSWNELYTACQTGVVDGQENAPNTMILASLQEVQKFYTLDNHTANIVCFNINEKFYQSLSPTDRKTINRATRLALESFMGLVNAKESRDIAFLGTKMKITVLTPEEMGKFKQACFPSILEYLKKEIGSDKVDKFVKQVEEINKKVY